jgi:hypothetical protein
MAGQWFYGAFFILSGLKVAHSGYQYRRTLERARCWPTADGEIETCELCRNENGIWSAEIVYLYWVDGTEYESSIVHADGEMNVGFTDRYARSRVEQYPVGTTVIVHHCPDDPQMAFLENKTAVASSIWIGAGVLLIIAGVVIGVIA